MEAVSNGWEKIIGDAGRSVGAERYGASAEYQTLYRQFRIRGRYHDARRVLDQLATVGVDFEDVTEQLEREGLAKFEKSWNELSHTIAAELHRNHPARQS